MMINEHDVINEHTRKKFFRINDHARKSATILELNSKLINDHGLLLDT